MKGVCVGEWGGVGCVIGLSIYRAAAAAALALLLLHSLTEFLSQHGEKMYHIGVNTSELLADPDSKSHVIPDKTQPPGEQAV